MIEPPLNTKTRVRYRNYIPAKVTETRKKGRCLQYKLQWTKFKNSERFTKWVNAKECTQVVNPPNKIQKVLYYLIKIFNKS